MNEKKKIQIGLYLGILGGALSILTFLLPYAERGEETKSLLGMAGIYLNSSAADWNYTSTGDFYRVFVPMAVGLTALFVILYLVMTILRKPVGMLVFNIISFLIYSLLRWDFASRGVVPGACDKKVAYTMIYIAFVIMLAGTVFRFIDKHNAKTQIIAPEETGES